MTGGDTAKDRLVKGIGKSIKGDMIMSSFSEIHHIWIHPDSAYVLDFTRPGQYTGKFMVEHLLTIDISNDAARGRACGFETKTGRFLAIDLGLDKTTKSCLFDISGINDRFIEGVSNINPSIVANGGHVWLHPCVAFLAVIRTDRSFQEIVNNISAKGRACLTEVPFGINHTFQVEVSFERPKSIRPGAECYTHATVDKNGWIVGERTPEEVARIPQGY